MLSLIRVALKHDCVRGTLTLLSRCLTEATYANHALVSFVPTSSLHGRDLYQSVRRALTTATRVDGYGAVLGSYHRLGGLGYRSLLGWL